MVHEDKTETERRELSYNVKGTPLEKDMYSYHSYGTDGSNNLPNI